MASLENFRPEPSPAPAPQSGASPEGTAFDAVTAAASGAVLHRSDPPLFIVLNVASGRHDPATTREQIAEVLNQAGREHRIFLVRDARRLHATVHAAVEAAQRCGGAVVAAGGDGTINAVAQQVLGSGCLFGVLPQGTFNYFGRTHEISDDVAEATRALLLATPHPVQVGLVNDRVFIVNASVGLYPRLLEEREGYKRQYGRSRWVARLGGLASLMRGHRVMQLAVEVDETGLGDDARQSEAHRIRTPTMFVGNNRLQLEALGLEDAQAVEQGRLVAIAVKPVGTLSMLWLALRGVVGQLGDAENVVNFDFARMRVRPMRRRVKVAIDGELTWLEAPLVFRVADERLQLLKMPAREDVPSKAE